MSDTETKKSELERPNGNGTTVGDTTDDESTVDATAGDNPADAVTEAAQTQGNPPESETSSPDDLKIVVSVRGGITTIGVQRPSFDAHIESFAHREMSEAVLEITEVVERATVRWASEPQHPAYTAPNSQGARQTRQETTQPPAADEESERQQATLF